MRRRTLVLILPLAALAAVRAPLAGLALAVGAACGLLNTALVARNNERLLDGGRSRGAYATNNLVRIAAVAAVPAVLAARGPWLMAVYFAGFFAPLILHGILGRTQR